MTTTRDYGTWNNHGDMSSVRVEDSVAAFLNEFVDDYDFDNLVAAYREAINKALPEDVALRGDNFYGPYPQIDDAGELIREAIESVNLSELAEQYDKTAQ